MKLTFRAKLFLYFVTIILLTSIPITLINYNYIDTRLKTLVTLSVFIVSIFLTFIFTKQITKPITELTALMHEAENGNLTVRANNIHTKDEFGELGTSFNLMIKKFSSIYEELTATERTSSTI